MDFYARSSLALDAESATFAAATSRNAEKTRGPVLEDPWVMASRIISERAFAFACRIVRLCEKLWARGPAARKIADQLFDSGTSIGANAEEAEGAQTKPDFILRLAISRKESRESIYWLRLAIDTTVTTKDEVAWELDEASQLRAMITQAIRTAQSSSWRGGS